MLVFMIMPVILTLLTMTMTMVDTNGDGYNHDDNGANTTNNNNDIYIYIYIYAYTHMLYTCANAAPSSIVEPRRRDREIEREREGTTSIINNIITTTC